MTFSFNSLKSNPPFCFGLSVFIVLHLYLIFRPTEFVFFSTYYPVYAVALAWLMSNRKQVNFNKDLLFVLYCCVILTALAIINTIVNDIFERRYLLNWLAWLMIVFFVSSIFRGEVNRAKLSYIAKVILLIQFCIAVIQLFDPHAFDFLWSSIKNRGLESHVRVCGSFSSPIAFSSFITYLTIWIIAQKGPAHAFFWVLFAAAMIIMSASRTMILLYPLIISAWFYLEGDETVLTRLMKSLVCAVIIYIVIFLFIWIFKDIFVYASELLSLLPFSEILVNYSFFDSGRYTVYAQEHEFLKTYGMREEIWTATLHEYFSKNMLEILIGGGQYSYNTAHQDLLFIVTRYGLVGSIVYLSLLAKLLSLGYQNRADFEGKNLYLVCLLIIGVGTVNTFGVEMRFGILIAIATGLVLSKKVYRSHYAKVVE